MKNFASLPALLGMFLILGCLGCAKMRYNYTPGIVEFQSPEINVETTVRRGAEMLAQGRAPEQEMIHIFTPIDGIYYDIPAGNYEKTGHDKTYQYFKSKGTLGEVSNIFFADSAKGLFVQPEKDSICVMSIFDKTYCYTGKYEILKKRDLKSSTVHRSLVFNGKEDDTVFISYIERAFNVVTFSYPMTININKSKIFEYQGAKIKILSASDDSICYTVLNTFQNTLPPSHQVLSIPNEKILASQYSKIEGSIDSIIKLYNINCQNLDLPAITKTSQFTYDKDYLITLAPLSQDSNIIFFSDKTTHDIKLIAITYSYKDINNAFHIINKSTVNVITSLEPYLSEQEKEVLLKSRGFSSREILVNSRMGQTKKLLYLYLNKSFIGKVLYIMPFSSPKE